MDNDYMLLAETLRNVIGKGDTPADPAASDVQSTQNTVEGAGSATGLDLVPNEIINNANEPNGTEAAPVLNLLPEETKEFLRYERAKR